MPDVGDVRIGEDLQGNPIKEIYSDTDPVNNPLPSPAWRKANQSELTKYAEAFLAAETNFGGGDGLNAFQKAWLDRLYPPSIEQLEPQWFKGHAEVTTDSSGNQVIPKIGEAEVGGVNASTRAAMHARQAGFKVNEFEIITGTGKYAGYVSWQKTGKEDPDKPAKQTWTTTELPNGDVVMYDKEVGMSSQQTLFTAPTVTQPDAGVEPAGEIQNADGSVTKFYTVTGPSGRASMQQVTTTSDDREVGSVLSADGKPIDLGAGKGDFYYLGNGQYQHVPDIDEPFQIDTKEGAGDIVPVPTLGGQLIRTSRNQYQFVRDTYASDDPTVKTDDSGRQYQQQIDGSWKELAERYEAGVIESDGRKLLQQITGEVSELAPQYKPDVADVDGMALLQQRTGAISQLTKPTMDQIITQALVDGEYDKAFAFQDFQDRPTANEAFQTALQFARSPADQVLISAIARGEQTVQPPPADTIQRVGPQADFLVDAYRDFLGRTQAGRAPTEEEIGTGVARSEAGATPAKDLEIETLQARLERTQQDTRNAQRAFEAEEERTNNTWQQTFDQTTTANDITNASATAKANAVEANESRKNGDDLFAGTKVGEVPTSQKSQTSLSLDRMWDRLNDSQKTFFTDQYMRSNRGRIPEGSEALTDFANSDPQKFEQNLKYHLERLSSEAGGPVATEELGNPASGIWYNKAFAAQYQQQQEETEIPPEVSTEIPPEVSTEIPPEVSTEIPPEVSTEETIITDDPGGAATGTSPLITYQPAPGFLDPQRSDWSTEYQAANVAAVEGFGLPAPGTPASNISGSPRTNVPNAPLPLTRSNTGFTPLPTRSTWPSSRPSGRKGKGMGLFGMAGGGTVGNKELTVVGEDGPEIAMFPAGTHILPLGRATKRDIRSAQSTGRAYQSGGIVFGELPFGIRQLQAGRPITPSRGYLSRAAGLTLPSAQALQNLTPESRDVYFDLAQQAGIPSRAFGQELQTTMPRGTRLPTSRMLPLGRQGVR
jgi:hypothetical protein